MDKKKALGLEMINLSWTSMSKEQEVGRIRLRECGIITKPQWFWFFLLVWIQVGPVWIIKLIPFGSQKKKKPATLPEKGIIYGLFEIITLQLIDVFFDQKLGIDVFNSNELNWFKYLHIYLQEFALDVE